jgi:hypothetical protein
MRMILPLVFGWLMVTAVAALYLQPWSWAWHPQTTLGWIVVFVLIAPLLTLLGEFLFQRVVFRNPIAQRLDALGPGAGPSALRVTYVLICFIAVGVAGIFAFGWLNKTGWLGAL